MVGPKSTQTSGRDNNGQNVSILHPTLNGLMLQAIGLYEIFTSFYEKYIPPPDHSICYNDLNNGRVQAD